ncbi:hypothetical protein [Stenotrophomonas sp. YAU14A_MKIMI4_1]|uniref:hypothetical protein n=1 Tax=Stenotrophomonas sp. YAU14A_MKIMI4_1 TaxID=2072408 RepID=UPI000D53EF83|nr:hypothetical protein [Stenotrophomonas sp. YAU14A_MKIMI4_1]AWH27842.1 hypothetical protein C1931_02205 [Stenotrophomonas sp. YAU14A_MKIMI4_1]
MSNSDEQEGRFDLQLIIGPTIVAGIPLLRRLDVAGAFDMNASQNRLNLPAEAAAVARAVGAVRDLQDIVKVALINGDLVLAV